MRGIGRVDWPVKDYTSLQFEIKTNLATKEIQVSARGKNTFCRDAFCLSDVCGFFMFLINQRDQCRRRYLSEAFEVMLEKLETGGSMSNKERREIKNTTGQHVARIFGSIYIQGERRTSFNYISCAISTGGTIILFREERNPSHRL